MDLIKEATRDCPREDCSLTSRGGASTCMAWTPTYDKHGHRTDSGDPNIHSGSLKCSSCGREWITQTQYGKTSVTEVAIKRTVENKP